MKGFIFRFYVIIILIIKNIFQTPSICITKNRQIRSAVAALQSGESFVRPLLTFPADIGIFHKLQQYLHTHTHCETSQFVVTALFQCCLGFTTTNVVTAVSLSFTFSVQCFCIDCYLALCGRVVKGSILKYQNIDIRHYQSILKH